MAKRDKEFEARMQGMISEHDAEVRAKAIDEFAEKLINEDYAVYGSVEFPEKSDTYAYRKAEIEEIAEKLKGGATHEIN